MSQYRIHVNGIPFMVSGDGNADQVKAALAERIRSDPSLLQKRRDQLGLTDEQVELNKKLHGGQVKLSSGGWQDFLIGAGRTFTRMGRGAGQLIDRATGDIDALKASQALESEERELFNKLDSQGIGWEDVGEFAPDLLMFLGGGGIFSTAARGGALGYSMAEGEGEDLADRTINAATTATLSALGPAGAKAVKTIRSVMPTSARLSKGGVSTIVNTTKQGKGNYSRGVANILSDAADLEKHANPQLQALGRMGYKRAQGLIQAMNSRGKEGMAAELANAALAKSIRQSDGGNIIDFGMFSGELANIGKHQMAKELGPAFGKHLDELRVTFDELSTVGSMPPEAAEGVIRAFMGDATTRELAKSFRAAKKPESKMALFRRITERAGTLARDVQLSSAMTRSSVQDLQQVFEQSP